MLGYVRSTKNLMIVHKARYTYYTYSHLGVYNLDFSAIIAAEFGRLSMLSLVI